MGTEALVANHGSRCPDLPPGPVAASESQLMLARDPQQIVADAERVGIALRKVVDRVPPLLIKGQQYLRASDWQLVGAFFNVSPRIVETRPLTDARGAIIGFEAVCELEHVITGHRFGRAEGQCEQSEKRFRNQTNAQRRAMAQVRASRRVLSQTFGWAIRLAGFADRPAEELEELEDDRPRETISARERRELWHVAREQGWTPDQIATQLEALGLPADTRTLPRAAHGQLLEALRKGPPTLAPEARP